MTKISFNKKTENEMKFLAIKLIPPMMDKLENGIIAAEVATKYTYSQLLLKQMQFIFAALGIEDKQSDFLSAKLEINSAAKELLKNHLWDVLKISDVSLSNMRIINQRIAQIETSDS